MSPCHKVILALDLSFIKSLICIQAESSVQDVEKEEEESLLRQSACQLPTLHNPGWDDTKEMGWRYGQV